eukprot:383884-Prymnesium_polylepis.1
MRASLFRHTACARSCDACACLAVARRFHSHPTAQHRTSDVQPDSSSPAPHPNTPVPGRWRCNPPPPPPRPSPPLSPE